MILCTKQAQDSVNSADSSSQRRQHSTVIQLDNTSHRLLGVSRQQSAAAGRITGVDGLSSEQKVLLFHIWDGWRMPPGEKIRIKLLI